jgi:hypothetical protein
MSRTLWRPTGYPPPEVQIVGQRRSSSGFTWWPVGAERDASAPEPPVADELRAAVSLVRRLSPDRQDPEAFHLAKAEAEQGLAALARRIERKAA